MLVCWSPWRVVKCDGQAAQGVARSGLPITVSDQKGSSPASVLAPLRACSRALMRFLAAAVLRLNRIDSLPVSTMWQWCVSRSSSAVVIFASPARGAFRLQLMVCGRTSLTIFPRELSVSQRGVSGILCKRFGLQLTEKRSPN